MESNNFTLHTIHTRIAPIQLHADVNCVWGSNTLTGQCQRSCSCPRLPAWALQQISSPGGQQTKRSEKRGWMSLYPHCHGRQTQTGMGSAFLHRRGWLQWQQGDPGRDLKWSDVGRRVSTPPGCHRCQDQSSCSCGPSSLHSDHWDLRSLCECERCVCVRGVCVWCERCECVMWELCTWCKMCVWGHIHMWWFRSLVAMIFAGQLQIHGDIIPLRRYLRDTSTYHYGQGQPPDCTLCMS